ncbi:MAG TPA: hypothetical protein VFC19_16900 [Candidatus Limnocylindrales bacterium]|nr:hypothetical protein [Candidatus Limnocylindrales bacterium]
MTAIIDDGPTPASDLSDPIQGGRWQRWSRLFEQYIGCTVKEFAIACAVSLGVTLVWVIIMPVVAPSQVGGDPVTYIAMAADPKGVHWSPLAFRVLEPWLAHELGGQFHYLEAFRYMSWAAQALIGPAVYLITRKFKGTHGAGILGIAGLMSLPMWLFLIYCPYLVDSFAMLTMAWTLVALIYGWLWVLPVLLVFMGLARETVIGFAVPIYMWMRSRWIDLPRAIQVACLIGPAVIVVWAIRQPMETTGYNTMLGLMYAGLWVYVRRDFGGDPVFYLTYGVVASMGIWWLLAIVGRRHVGRLWWLLVPVFAQWLFGSDWGRYALYAFPVVIPAAVIAVWSHPRRTLLLILIGLQSVAISADLILRGRPAIYDMMPSTWVSLGLMVLTALVIWLPRTGAPGKPLETAR